MTNATSSIAVLKANSFGEYEYAERNEFGGDLNDYLGECDGATDVCPDDETPITHNCNGATILRTEHHNGGENQDETWYSYEAFWAAGGE